MAKKELVESIVKLYSKLGGNMNDVLGSRSNITFLGTGKNPEPFVDMSINMEAVGALGKSKILEELKSPIGYLTADKLNDVQAGKLYENMLKLDEFYNPRQVANITDMATRTGDLDPKGLAALREKTGDTPLTITKPRNYEGAPRDFEKAVMTDSKGNPIQDTELAKRLAALRKKGVFDIKTNKQVYYDDIDLPPPGSRGGADDIAAPIQDAETTIRNLEKQDPKLAAQFKNILSNRAELPAKRASAREFLVEALKADDTFATKLGSVVSTEDVKFITEGGGGIAGDPLILVEKYFGPRISEMIPVGATGEEIITFTRRVMNNVEDAAGLKPDNPRFDRFTARFVDEMAQGGRVGLLNGGKAKRQRFFQGALADTKEGKAMSPGTTASGGFRGDAGQGDTGNIIVPPPDNTVFQMENPMFNTELVNRKIALDRALANYDLNNVVEDEEDQNINTTGVTQNTIDTIFNPDVASNIDQIKTTTTNLLNADPDLKASLGMAQGGRAGFMAGGIGKFTKAQVLIERLKNTIKDSKGKTDELSVYVNETFPGFIKEIKANPKLAENENVWKTLGLDLPKDQRLVVHSDDTVDFFTQTKFGPHNIELVEKFMAKHPFLSREDALRILKMEPEDRVLEITRLEVLNRRTKNAHGGLAKILEV